MMSNAAYASQTLPNIHPVQTRKEYFFAILSHQVGDWHRYWVEACERSDRTVKYRVVDLTSNDWLPLLLADDYDCFLAYPPVCDAIKRIYDERTYMLSHVLSRRLYPTFEEMLVYENKRVLSSWLQANQIPHPRTWVFCQKEDALEFARHSNLPIVAKTSVGSHGKGVEIIKSRDRLEKYIHQAFSRKGIRLKYSPNLRKIDLIQRTLVRLGNVPAYIRELRDGRNQATNDTQRGFVFLQEYVPCDYEWRVVRIGKSYFAHKKLPRWGVKISGTSRVGWDRPPDSLLDFVRYVCDKRGFYSQAVDLFEPEPGKYLVNELQCFFGSRNPHQMLLDGRPGRYVRNDEQWIFEQGDFNALNSFALRLKHVMELMDTERL